MIMSVRALALALLLAAVAGVGPARADTRSVNGDKLVLTDTISSNTIISTDPSLSGQVRVSMDGDLGCLSLTGGGTAIVSTSGCSESGGSLRIEVPQGMPMTISASGDGELHLGNTAAPLVLEMNGSGDVVGGDTGPLVLSVHGNSDISLGKVKGGAVLEMTGSGDVRLGGLEGGLTLRHQGSGDLAVGHIESSSVVLESTGSGDMLIGAGTISTLTANMRGHGDLGVAAAIRDADVHAYGGGDVKLGQVTGRLNRVNGDNSDIYVGGPEVVNTIIGQVAKAVGEGKDSSSSSSGHSTHHTFPAHILTILLVGIMAFILWRMVKRRGGVSGLRAQPTVPTHPGVVSLCETMSRLDQRLGRVESYVTSREFELHQKFKKL